MADDHKSLNRNFELIELVTESSFDSSLSHTVEPGVDPPLPEVPEWPRSERLAGEKEMLGFYVTGHPLMEHAEALARFADVGLDALDESWRGRKVRLAGMLSSLNTQKTRRGGLMARARLEDLAGTLDVVIFPDAFDRLAELLRSSEPLLLGGDLVFESDRPELQLDEAIPLSSAWDRAVRELRLCVGVDRVSAERLEELRRILDLVPGEVPVTVKVALPTGTEVVLGLTRHRVAVTQDLVHSVEELFGGKVVECRL